MKKLLCLVFLMIVVSVCPAVIVTLAWDQSPDPIVSSYGVYWGPSSRNYTNVTFVAPQTKTTVSIGNLIPGSTYYFAATCRATNGLESDFSIEISYNVPTNIPPVTYIGSRLEWWTNMAYINRQTFYLTSFTNPPSPQFYRTFLVVTNGVGTNTILLKSRLEWYTNMANINRQTFDLRTFTNASYFFRSFLVITNKPF